MFGSLIIKKQFVRVHKKVAKITFWYHEANIEGGGKTVHVVFIICLEVCCGKGGGG
jgi:hypothetical protein